MHVKALITSSVRVDFRTTFVDFCIFSPVRLQDSLWGKLDRRWCFPCVSTPFQLRQPERISRFMPFGIANGEMDGLVWRPADNVVHLVRLRCWERRKTVETKLFEVQMDSKVIYWDQKDLFRRGFISSKPNEEKVESTLLDKSHIHITTAYVYWWT